MQVQAALTFRYHNLLNQLDHDPWTRQEPQRSSTPGYPQIPQYEATSRSNRYRSKRQRFHSVFTFSRKRPDIDSLEIRALTCKESSQRTQGRFSDAFASSLGSGREVMLEDHSLWHITSPVTSSTRQDPSTIESFEALEPSRNLIPSGFDAKAYGWKLGSSNLLSLQRPTITAC